jgi:hypothetical protein
MFGILGSGGTCGSGGSGALGTVGVVMAGGLGCEEATFLTTPVTWLTPEATGLVTFWTTVPTVFETPFTAAGSDGVCWAPLSGVAVPPADDAGEAGVLPV